MNDSNHITPLPVTHVRRRPRVGQLGWVQQDCRCFSDRIAASGTDVDDMDSAEGFFQLHTDFPVPSNKRDQIIAGFANFTKDGTAAKTFGKQLEEIAALAPTTPIAQILALRAKTAETGQPAKPNTFDGWRIALRFENIGIDTTDDSNATLGDDVYHRHYTSSTELVVEVTLNVPLGTDIGNWGALRAGIESDNETAFERAKDDLITIVQNESLGDEAENLIDALTLA